MAKNKTEYKFGIQTLESIFIERILIKYKMNMDKTHIKKNILLGSEFSV